MPIRNTSLTLVVVVPAVFTPLLADGMSAVEWFALIGLLTGHVFAFFVGRGYASKRTAEDAAPSPRALSEDVTFTVLKNRRRRETLRYLRRAGGTASLSELAEHVAAKENDVETHQLTSAQRKRVYIPLYQCHLPMMDDANVIEFDQSRGSVELLDAASELFEHMDDLQTRTES